MLGIAVVLVITPLKDYYFYQLRAVGAYEFMGMVPTSDWNFT